MVVWITTINSELIDNPVLMFILGAFVNQVTIIYIFYYRKNPNNEKFPSYDEKPDNGICPCCGQKASTE